MSLDGDFVLTEADLEEIYRIDEDELEALLDAPLMAYLKRQEEEEREEERKRATDEHHHHRLESILSEAKVAAAAAAASTSRHPDRDREHRRRNSSRDDPRHRSRSRSRHRHSHHHHSRHSSDDRRKSPSRAPKTSIHSTPTIPTTTTTTTDPPILTEAQRDRRTVFVRQLAQRTTPDDLRAACETVLGVRVRDVRLVLDRISKRSKGVAYVEFCDEDAVPKAVSGLSGHLLNGIPMIVELTETEKNRIAEETAEAARRAKREEQQQQLQQQHQHNANHHHHQQASSKPRDTRVFVGSLHPNIGEAQLDLLFRPFGPIEAIRMGGGSSGAEGSLQQPSTVFAHITFRYPHDAKSAVDQMNGFHLVDRPIKVALMRVEEQPSSSSSTSAAAAAADLGGLVLDEDEERTVALTPQARTELMLKLARDGSGRSSGRV